MSKIIYVCLSTTMFKYDNILCMWDGVIDLYINSDVFIFIFNNYEATL